MPPIQLGEKFACLAFRLFSLAESLPAEVELGYGCWALPGPPVPIDGHWRGWLGELETEQIQNANLVLFAKVHSSTPGVLDHENNLLLDRVQYLHWGIIIAAGVPTYDHDVMFTGADSGHGPELRSVSHPHAIYTTAGMRSAQVTVQDLADGSDIVTQIERVLQGRTIEGHYKRLMRGLNAFVAGLRARQAEDRLHQFVRTIESFLPPTVWGAAAFANHARDFLPEHPDPGALLMELYQLRNIAEHHGDLDRGLPNVPPAQRAQVADRRVRQAECLARAVYRKIFRVRSGFLDLFRDDASIIRFWSEPAWIRRRILGKPFDVHQMQ